MTDAERIVAAEAEVAVRRERFAAAMSAVQRRVQPSRLASDARRSLLDAREAATVRATEAIKRQPGALAGVVAAAGLFLARHRITALFRKERKATRSKRAS